MTNSTPRRSRARSAAPAPRRGFIAQISAVLLQPGAFFTALPDLSATRQWVAVAALLMLLLGASAVRQAEQPASTGAIDGPSMGFESSGMGGPIPGDFGAPPPDMGVPGGAPAPGAGADPSQTLSTALVAAAGLLLAWAIQMLLLSEVSLFNGQAPSLSRNFHIAIWASVPLGLMAALQLAYYAAGGKVGQPGISGIIAEQQFFMEQSAIVQNLLWSAASQLTLFGVWSAILLYVGARRALAGRWYASLLVVIAWAFVLVVTPVLTGAIDQARLTPEESQVLPVDPGMGMEIPPDMEMPPADMPGASLDFPGDESAPIKDSTAPGDSEAPVEVRPLVPSGN